MEEVCMARRKSRDPRKEAFWRRVLARQARSGMSVRAWCHRHALRESSFYWWRTQLVGRDAEAPGFVPVRVTTDRSAADGFDLSAGTEPAGRLEIVLPRGRRVQVLGPVDRQALTDVLAVLASRDTAVAGSAAC